MAADIGHGQADDDLDGVAVLDQAEGTGIGELAGRSDLIRVVDRNAQAGCAVGDFADIVRTAEAIEEDLGFQGIGTAGNAFFSISFLALYSALVNSLSSPPSSVRPGVGKSK